MSAVLSFILGLPAIFKAISEMIGVVNQIRRMFQTDPVAEQAKKEADHAKSQQDAETKDDTSGGFAG